MTGPAHIRPRRDEDNAAIVEIMHRVSPEYPAMSAEEFAAQLATNQPYGRQSEFVAESDGRVIGCGYLLEMYWTGHPGAYLVGIDIAPEYCGRGAGSALHGRLMSKAREWKARRLSAGVREDRPTALAFALKRGFRENGPRSHMSRLEVDQVNLDGYAGLAERLAASGIRVTRLAELNLDDGLFLRSLHAMHIAAAQDEPTAERLDASFEVWWHGTLHQAGVSPETVWVAFSGGSPIGLTALQLRGGAGTAFGLAVDREFRGRGVARLLKLHQIEWARDHGLHYLFTGNSADNPRMYDINLRLGFEPLPAVIHLTREMGGPE